MIRAIWISVLSGAMLCMPAACVERSPLLEGVYALSDKDGAAGAKAELRLGRSNRFSYTVPELRGDVLTTCTGEGTYSVRDNWITLSDSAHPGTRRNCLDADRIYVVVENGEPLLFPDWRLAIVSQKQQIVPDAWRRTGAPIAYTRKLKEWMPQPYARYLDGSRLAGLVSSTGKPVTQRVPEPIERYWTHMPVSTDLGTEQGAFEGMWVCGPDQQPRQIYEVSARASKIAWEGSVTAGTPLSGPCVR